MARRRNAQSWFALQALLLGLPLVLLAVLGAYLIRQDKASVEAEARGAIVQSAERVLNLLSRARTNFDERIYLDLTRPWPAGTAFFQIDSNYHLLFPSPLSRDPERGLRMQKLAADGADLWRSAEQAEFQTNDAAAALRLWVELLQRDLPTELRPVAEYQRAVLMQKAGRKEEASREFQSLAGSGTEARLETGMPVAQLAAFKLFEGGLDAPTAYISNLLVRPSEFTPMFLRAGMTSQFESVFANALAAWEQQEGARALSAELKRLLNNGVPNKLMPGALSVVSKGERWWLSFVSPTTIFARSETNLADLAEGIVRSTKGEAPSYFALHIFDGTTPIYTPLIPPKDRPWHEVASPENALRCEIYLTDLAPLYARQRERARGFTALLVASSACAAFGLVYAHRNHRRQMRLNELKSNFVSSVSHELRAPLASMRLMSEGLQSGRIHDPEKQREYFNFLVQESRRLSTLIENVLDFSRIEQDRRTFQFEMADLAQICQAALKTVGPIAAEHQVRLEIQRKGHQEHSIRAVVDSGALHQAIVNLLDNAIKHSPPGETVTLTLSASLPTVEIAIHDNGPGIDPSEHERIFDRFYRLGSELRRETQGVGIGLSIVRHTIEAHRGTVRVESATGRGATFILSLPKSLEA